MKEEKTLNDLYEIALTYMRRNVCSKEHPTWTRPYSAVMAFCFRLCPATICLGDALLYTVHSVKRNENRILILLEEIDRHYSEHANMWASLDEQDRAKEVARYLKKDVALPGTYTELLQEAKQRIDLLLHHLQQGEEKENEGSDN